MPFGRTGTTTITDTVRFGGKNTTVYEEWRKKPSTEVEYIDYFKKKSTGDETAGKRHGGAIELEDINFDFNSSKLSAHIQGYLSRLAIFLNEYPQYNVELLGHTDGIGNVEANMALSQRRCRAVYDHLVNLLDPIFLRKGSDRPQELADDADLVHLSLRTSRYASL